MTPFHLRCFGYIIFAPIWLGAGSRVVVDAYHGRTGALSCLALSALVAAWIWSAVRRKRATTVKSMTVTHWDETHEGVTFHGIADDGETGQFSVKPGSGFKVTTTQAVAA